MSMQTLLTCDEIRDYIVANGGKVLNNDLVKHFKRYLTDPLSKDVARVKFKEYVNLLATIKTENNEKYVVLRRKYHSSLPYSSSSPCLGVPAEQELPVSPRQPPPYRPPPQVVSPTHSTSDLVFTRDELSLDNISQSSFSSDLSMRSSVQDPPQAPPRRKSQENKMKLEHNKENVIEEYNLKDENGNKNEAYENEQTISVKERMQKFNRLASETDVKAANLVSNNQRKRHEKGGDDDDSVSVTSLDPKSREWLVKAAICEYQILAKLAGENPRLVRCRDPITGYTGLHWAAKHGNQDVVKLMAGTHGADVNVRTNGGYTPLHLAIQFGHEDIYNLLVNVYKADTNLRDWSGRLARSYLQTCNTSVSAETFKKIKARRKQTEKDLGFLRIGSLNVRVKKTTEAFSNFLGVGGGTTATVQTPTEKLLKSWGSADNLPQKMMPPPKYNQIKKRKSKKPQDFVSTYNPELMKTQKHSNSKTDSDSDTACGFDLNWQTKLE